MSSATFVPLLLLSVVAPLGAFDVLYFHLYRFRLHARRRSRAETATHVARGVLIGTVAVVLASYEPRGAWYVAIAVLVVLDFVNNLLDVWLEPASRADLGGVPPFEYLIHMIGSTAGGAVAAAFLLLGHGLADLPTEMHPGSLPAWLAWNGWAIGVGSFAIAGLETVLVVRAARAGTKGLRPAAV